MKNTFILLLFFICINSCKISGSGSEDDNRDPSKTYKLKLNPTPGSSYYYDISNESEIEMEVEGKNVKNLNEANAGINYRINKDSSGNFVFTLQYDKIHIHTRNGDNETESDAANASFSINPTEKMLGKLKEGVITATINPSGEVINMTGYKEIGASIISGFAENDVQGRSMAQAQWDRVIGEGLVKRNMDQLFRVFPDSAVHLGDTWKLKSSQEGELKLNVTGSYTLKTITPDIALIQSTGKISGDKSIVNMIGMGEVTTDLTGEQEAEYEMETSTGMLLSCRIVATVKGTLSIMGRDIPVNIKTTVKMTGKKMQ